MTRPGGSPLRAVLYARVSTDTGQQDTETQLRLLRELCTARSYVIVAEHTDHVTGDPKRRRREPPGLAAALRLLQDKRAGVLVIFAADRLVRSPMALLQLVERVQSYGARIVSLQDGRDLDTTTKTGELMTFLLGWFARMALNLTRARTHAGLQRARAQGKQLGRPRVQLTQEQRDEVLERLGLEQPARQIAREMKISRRQVGAVAEWLKNGGVDAASVPERAEGA